MLSTTVNRLVDVRAVAKHQLRGSRAFKGVLCGLRLKAHIGTCIKGELDRLQTCSVVKMSCNDVAVVLP